ncbi:cold-shock protein [Kibdelosporangium persicum]|jgi:cold shock CspA family protein|uniref:2-phospho-L-lactate guanylyltransferase n=1 Tax=Kibdelosporangium persicum TaxID=2698649 RepID=A0ABX2FCW6_9PSEU|nr:cold-shock protein [Kibdelosporangium persicum]NRN68999.1 2-phospho-L-lactate guanylyltransferase [Kibdelosporangium persicum]
MQATVATFSAETRSGTVLLDDGRRLSFDASAFDRSGLRMLRLGQRVVMRVVDGRVEALNHIALPLD